MSHWQKDELFGAVAYEVIDEKDGIASIYYRSEPVDGKPTRVFAWMGVPAGEGVPGVVCIHGGGGKAFREWVERWNARGYAAIAMNLAGRGEDTERLPDGGPDQTGEVKFNMSVGWENTWTYHAIAAAIRAHSILRAHPRINAERTAATGISWGGYLTCIVSGVDDRFKCTAPVYGCGHLRHNGSDGWLEQFEKMSPEHRAFWDEYCDPMAYLPRARMPMLFVSGTNDHAYPLDSHQRSSMMPMGPVTRCIRLEMHHGHGAGWAPEEIGRFFDHHLLGKPPLPSISPMSREGQIVRSMFAGAGAKVKGFLLYTCDEGKWMDRKWYQVDASISGQAVSATLPAAARVWYLAIEDAQGNFVNTAYGEA